jgi:hypothetical protein
LTDADGKSVWSVKNGAANVTASKLCETEIQNTLKNTQSMSPGDCLVHKATGNRLILFPNGTLQLQNAKREIKWSHPGVDGTNPTCKIDNTMDNYGTFSCTSGSNFVDVTNSSYTALGLKHEVVYGAQFGFQADGTLAVRFA